MKVMFVCHGNICRSPMAEFILKDMVKKKEIANMFLIDSCATSREEIGNGIHCGTKRKLKEKGIPYGEHFARQITKQEYDSVDYFLCMDHANIQNLFRILKDDPEKKIYRLLDFCEHPRDIADPWYTGDFERTYQDIVEGCEAFLKKLNL